MKKEEQNRINEIVRKEYNRFSLEVEHRGMQYIGRLRSCSAEVWASDSYYILRSYSTIIAVIDNDGVLYDFLRMVYGYTATSAQHISKFMQDYGCGTRYTYKWA